MTDFVSVSEKYRKKFSEKLRESLSLSDIQTNQIFELNQSKRLSAIQYELVEGKLNMMFDSVNAISNAKNLEDKYRFEIDRLQEKEKELINSKADQDQLITQVIKEKDAYRQEVKDMVEFKNKLEREKQFLQNNLKDSTSKY